MAGLATAAFTALVLLASSYAVYRSLLGLIGLLPPRRNLHLLRFDASFLVIVPAKNEEHVIAETIASIHQIDYPRDRVRLFVIADQCRDATAAVARHAGAEVIERSHGKAGKGEAIRWVLSHPRIARQAWDALVVLDADCHPAPGFLKAMAVALSAGALSIQGLSIVRPRSSIMARAYGLKARVRNTTWHMARERLGLSAALTGSGMCISREALSRVPWETSTLTEDLEYGARLELAGIRTHFLPSAISNLEGPGIRASFSQRLRWVRGQVGTAARFAPRLIAFAIRNRRPSALDSALYLAIPSLAPVQFLLLGAAVADSFVPSLLSVPSVMVWSTLGLTMVPTLLAPLADGLGFGLVDALGYGLLMISWLPIALVGAVTVRIFDWRPTPHGDRSVPGRRAPREASARSGE